MTRVQRHGMSCGLALLASLIALLSLIATGSGGLAAAEHVHRLADGWEHYQGSLGSTWEVWRGEAASDNVAWTPVTLPHCFNARDAVDPDVRYYQGPGWYRTRLAVANPFPGGRTLIHFDGAGQRSQVFIGTELVGEHLGGYDEWTVDITEAAARAVAKEAAKESGKEQAKAPAQAHVPLAVMCDNSRDAESVPSDLSDFNRYGGLYRHVSLIHVPSISVERVHVEPRLEDGKAVVRARARLHNPGRREDPLDIRIEVSDPDGAVVHEETRRVPPWDGERVIAGCTIASPRLWSPATPAL